ncbi:hypothetical protein BU14_0717s0006 [Porphyra umbilicalis]|uniref:Uncharacterized protein n=1 Tax=Porphyra umbilicalis TaxID=2786 RepID=A0A1X6NPK4_PORUM|nr:hypothetical protein BU14_0717s0006 [Porphyra umbilicalis]|eukprot:OSX70579.1 hypothetical protein BU14_0717s0006 [Porphyra umbilicalis]
MYGAHPDWSMASVVFLVGSQDEDDDGFVAGSFAPDDADCSIPVAGIGAAMNDETVFDDTGPPDALDTILVPAPDVHNGDQMDPHATANVYNTPRDCSDEITPVRNPSSASSGLDLDAGQDAPTPLRPATPGLGLDKVAFLLRCAFEVNDAQYDAIYSFLGVSWVLCVLCCLAGVNGDVEINLLHATIVALFSSPVRAVAFISKSLGVEEAALFMCGKLRRERHIELQPAAFPSGALRAYLNPWDVAVECNSRGLRVRKDISFTSAVQGPGNLTADELKALSERLMTGTGKRAADEAG